ncbi:uncharacterized protein PFLUO_LOCUS7471 [Penicillium psychrofluorescens]|uniref:uncharacterized protein n=1 Tax=Penicillium psychrofluorescens TaxID=3158075 RepID=UPI003CCE21FD
MAVEKINVLGDSRVEYRSATLNGNHYSYLFSQPPSGQYRATVFLIHGFPDLSMGWRYQIPMLVNLGLRVVAPDCLGYGRTDAPEEPIQYSHKRCAEDIKALAAHLDAPKIILGGHDWGAALVYRVALWHPDLITHVFTVCVPYARPQAQNIALEDLVRTAAPHFAYQLQFASGELEKVVRSKDEIRQFLIALYGGRTEKVNWYRTRKVNYEEELAILDRQITAPLLFIQALRDQALPPHLGKSMAKHIPNLTLKQVDTSHWALWEKPEEVNAILASWLKNVVFVDTRSGKL